jgi:chromosome segregation ATPase
MTTKQLIKDVSDIVTETHNDMHTHMNELGYMVQQNSNKIDDIDISCDCNREIRNLTDIVEKETTDISNDITNLKDNIEDWIDDSRTTLQESFSNEFDTINDAINTIAEEQDKLKDDIKDIREKLGEILTILHSLPK